MFDAKNGHLDCLKHALENYYQWGSDTCYYAAKNGLLNCSIKIKYAHDIMVVAGINIL